MEMYLRDGIMKAPQAQRVGPVNEVATDLKHAREYASLVVSHLQEFENPQSVVASLRQKFDRSRQHQESAMLSTKYVNAHASKAAQTQLRDEPVIQHPARKSSVSAGVLSQMLVRVSNPQEFLTDLLLALARDVTGNKELAEDMPLMESGMDSLAATEYSNLISKKLGRIKIGTNLIFEYPTIGEITTYLLEVSNTLAPIQPQQMMTMQLRVGLVDMACKLAGGKSAPDQLWSSLLSQTSHITHSPPQRWQGVCTRANAPAALLAGAFLDDELHSILAVEHGGFSAAEAKQLDMHIQLLLDTSMEALTDGGWGSSDVKSSRLGVFTASAPIDFVVPISGFNVARALASALRVTGPHRNTDAACSSGYLSTHHALDAVQAGECSAAVVAGVSLLLKPETALGLYMMVGVLSPSGNM